MRGVDGVADAAFHLHAQHQGVQEVAPGDGPILRERQDRRSHRTGRMDDGPEVRVVVIEDVRGDAVHQGRVQNVHALLAAEDGGLRRAGKRRERADGDVHGFVPRPSHRAADPVQQSPRCFLIDRVGNVFRFRRDNVFGKMASNVLGRGRLHGRDFIIPFGLRRKSGDGDPAHEIPAVYR